MKILILLSLVFCQSAFSDYRKGLTWGIQSSKLANNLVNVNCHGSPATVGAEGSPSCNAYVGDTYCSERRPVLCINNSNPIPRPEGIGQDRYNEWSSGAVRLTHDIEGYALNSIQAANAYCAEYFGPHWRMAEHHDGWGWGFWAVGQISTKTRFWVYIKNQPANCWDGGESDNVAPARGRPIERSRPPESLQPIEPKKSGLLQFM